MKKIFMICAVLVVGCAHKVEQNSNENRSLTSTTSTYNVEWASYARDEGSSKFSPANLINKSNVKNLKVVWNIPTPDQSILNQQTTPLPVSVNQSTPIMANGLLYISTNLNQVAALNPNSGETIWIYNPDLLGRKANPPNSGFVHRGVSYWSNGPQKRILFGTNDYYLTSLDAQTGQPDKNFGDGGTVDLLKGFRRAELRDYIGVTSPPAICGNVVIVGSSIADFALKKNKLPPGDVLAFDIRSGKKLWTFKTIPDGKEFGAHTWKNDSSKKASGANVWPPMSVDSKLNSVYLPVSTPSDDFYGGLRVGDGLFGESLVSLNCNTGKRNWHFQIVHHGLWDYDPPAPPILMDIIKNGKKIKAVAQVTKQAFAFVFDRVTGKPIWPIIEKSVPQTNVPGEVTSKTQPFPTKPAAFDRQGLNDSDIINFTPEMFNETKAYLSQFTYGPLYTPPSLEKPVVAMPGGYGGASWAGATYNPITQTLYVPSVTLPLAWGLAKDPDSEFPYSISLATTKQLRRPDGLPVVKPPYGRITAINMVTGEHSWVIASGTGPKNHPSLSNLKLPPEDLGWDRRTQVLSTPEILFTSQAGPWKLVGINKLTDGGIISTMISASNDEPMLKAIDAVTGKILSKVDIPGNATGAPMTYVFEGRQYIVIPYGGANLPAGFVALSL